MLWPQLLRRRSLPRKLQIVEGACGTPTDLHFAVPWWRLNSLKLPARKLRIITWKGSRMLLCELPGRKRGIAYQRGDSTAAVPLDAKCCISAGGPDPHCQQLMHPGNKFSCL